MGDDERGKLDMSGAAKAYSSDADLHHRQDLDPACEAHEWEAVGPDRWRCSRCGTDRGRPPG